MPANLACLRPPECNVWFGRLLGDPGQANLLSLHLRSLISLSRWEPAA